MNHELPDVQAGFNKGRRTRDQIANIYWIIEKAREYQKNIYFCFIDYAETFDCVDHNKLWKILKEMGICQNYEATSMRKKGNIKDGNMNVRKDSGSLMAQLSNELTPTRAYL